MKLKVNVTRSDLNKGKPCEANDCAIALALNKTLKKGYFTGVDGHTAYIYHSEHQNDDDGYVVLNKTLQDLVRNFDRTRHDSNVRKIDPVQTKVRITKKNAEFFKPSALEA